MNIYTYTYTYMNNRGTKNGAHHNHQHKVRLKVNRKIKCDSESNSSKETTSNRTCADRATWYNMPCAFLVSVARMERNIMGCLPCVDNATWDRRKKDATPPNCL